MKDTFRKLGAIPLRADWTDADPVISEFLHRNGIVAIPAYFIYPSDPSQPPILLPDGIISQKDVLRGLEKARQASR